MKNTLPVCARSLWDTVTAPIIRCECDHHYGLYKNKNVTHPIASFDTRRDSDIPLCKLLAVVGIAITMWIIFKKLKANRRICACANTKNGN